MIEVNYFSLDPNKLMVCKFTKEGLIYYINDYFTEVSGFDMNEILGKPIEYIKSPDLPMTIYNFIMDKLKEKQNTNIIMKGKTKDGRNYWFTTKFEFEKDKKGNYSTFISTREKAPMKPIPALERLYSSLFRIEEYRGIKAAEKYFESFLEEKGLSFCDYTRTLI